MSAPSKWTAFDAAYTAVILQQGEKPCYVDMGVALWTELTTDSADTHPLVGEQVVIHNDTPVFAESHLPPRTVRFYNFAHELVAEDTL